MKRWVFFFQTAEYLYASAANESTVHEVIPDTNVSLLHQQGDDAAEDFRQELLEILSAFTG